MNDHNPIYLCLDIPTGIYFPEQQEGINGELPPDIAEQIGLEFVKPVIPSIGNWWLENVVGEWQEGNRKELIGEIINNHWSDLTSFYLVPQELDGNRLHPLNGMLIALLVFEGCSRIDDQSLSRLEEQVLAVHPNGRIEAVTGNFGIAAVASPEDCISQAATLAMLVKNALKDSESRE